jgi:ABC-2 type transport system permease protein
MNRLLSFIQKEFRHIFRDVRSLIIIFGIPIAEVLIFGFAINTEIKDAHIAIIDHAKDATSREVINKLLSSDYFLLDAYLDSESQIEEAFKGGNVKQVVVFEPNFETELQRNGQANIQLILDASEPNTASMLNNYTSSIISSYIQEINQNNSTNMMIEPNVRMFYNPELRSVFMFVPGTMAIILLLISSLMTSITITREKELGTMEILLGSPLKPIQIIIGKVTPYLVLSIVNVVSILGMAYFVFGLPVNGSLVLLILQSILFILMALALGILISTVSKTMQQAMLISMVGTMLPSMLLSGFIYPVENMPDILYYISFAMPPRYFIDIVKAIMIKGSGMDMIWKETLVITGMTLFFIAMAAKKFKVRLE